MNEAVGVHELYDGIATIKGMELTLHGASFCPLAGVSQIKYAAQKSANLPNFQQPS